MSDSLYQNSYYIGIAFSGILYGIELVLYVQTIQDFFYRGIAHPSRATGRFFVAFNTALLLLVTMFVAVRAVFGQEMWIVNADFEGGSPAFLAAHSSVWYRTLGIIAMIILQLMSDAFLIYRCFIVYGNFLVLIFPCILWLVTLVFGILHLCYPVIPSGGPFVSLAAHIGITYFSASVGLSVIISSMICARIAYLRRIAHTSHTTSGKEEEIPSYKGAISITVETALLYAISGIPFVVSYGIGSGISALFFSIYVMCSCLSPQLIILRMAGGRAWKRYRPMTSSAIGLRDVPSPVVSPSLDSGAKVDSELQFRTPDPDAS